MFTIILIIHKTAKESNHVSVDKNIFSAADLNTKSALKDVSADFAFYTRQTESVIIIQ